jgi:hypothetical protein
VIPLQIKQILIWVIAAILAAAAVGLAHGLLGIVNPLLGSHWFDLLFFSGFSTALLIAVFVGVPVDLFYRGGVGQI